MSKSILAIGVSLLSFCGTLAVAAPSLQMTGTFQPATLKMQVSRNYESTTVRVPDLTLGEGVELIPLTKNIVEQVVPRGNVYSIPLNLQGRFGVVHYTAKTLHLQFFTTKGERHGLSILPVAKQNGNASTLDFSEVTRIVFFENRATGRAELGVVIRGRTVRAPGYMDLPLWKLDRDLKIDITHVLQ